MEMWGVIGRFEEDKVGNLRVMTLRVILTDGEAEIETARVAFNRSHSENKKMSFGDAVLAEREKAQQACEAVNAMLDEEDERRAVAVFETRQRVQEIVGNPTKKPV